MKMRFLHTFIFILTLFQQSVKSFCDYARDGSDNDSGKRTRNYKYGEIEENTEAFKHEGGGKRLTEIVENTAECRYTDWRKP